MMLSLRLLASVGVCMIMAGQLAHAADHHRVLIIYSWHDQMPWQAGIRAGMQETLDQLPESERPEIYEERMDDGRISVSDEVLSLYLQKKYANVNLDLVIAEAQSAASFLLRHPDLFPQANRYSINVAKHGLMEQSHIVTISEDVTRELLTVTQLLPECERVVAVVDYSENGQRIKNGLLAAAPLLPRGVTLEVWDNFSFDELYMRASQLSRGSAILYFPTQHDRNGARKIPRDVVRQLSQTAPVPVFGNRDAFLGYGIVGGYSLSSRNEGGLIAQIAQGITPATDAASVDARLKGYMFDDQQLARWNIPNRLLPTPNTVINREDSIWTRYGWQIGLSLAAILLEALLIAALIRSLQQRKTALGQLAQERDILEQRVQERTHELEKLATTDELTKVANRRKFLDVALAELDRAKRYGRPLSLLMLDIDRFKAINDTHGHACGDQVIHMMAQTCVAELREIDCVGRIGGEEFAIVLPEVDLDAARLVAERIRGTVESLNLANAKAGSIRFTVSVGVSTLAGGADSIATVMERADACLYRAKERGRWRATITVAGQRQLG